MSINKKSATAIAKMDSDREERESYLLEQERQQEEARQALIDEYNHGVTERIRYV